MDDATYRKYIDLGKRAGLGEYIAELEYKQTRSTEEGWSKYIDSRTGDAACADAAYATGYNSTAK